MPFAPAILDTNSNTIFPRICLPCTCKRLKKIHLKHKKKIPSAVHYDGTCRVQIVDRKVSGYFWNIINEFYKRTNIPMLLNT